MSDAAKEVAKACASLDGKESAPPVTGSYTFFLRLRVIFALISFSLKILNSNPFTVKSLYGLHFEITKIHILRLCTWMRATTEEISREEVWIPLSTLERNKSPYAISYLPLAFRAMTMSAMNQIDL